jgi:large subunit ribosomal protein L30
MKLEEFLGKKIIITQIKSGSKLNDRQKGSLFGLGIGKIGKSSSLICNPSNLGMIKKISHVVKILFV